MIEYPSEVLGSREGGRKTRRKKIEWWLPGAREGGYVELLFNGYRILVS